MNLIDIDIPGPKIIEPDVYPDRRGFFCETYQKRRFAENGIQTIFVQDNLSSSGKGTLRGLHYQHPHAQAKLVQVVQGAVLDVIVDIRRGSPFFGKWAGVTLSAENKRQFFVPEGFAHGYCVLSEAAVFTYKCSDYYAPDCEKGVLWSDPGIGIQWPLKDPVLSDKDRHYPCLKDVAPDALPE
ncbi:MAG: dTDP-4-dehydrorhamnose 3,5-epimerase [Deltaproteobacteria bacterium]|nr:dTDP-4-dehydrorhamnose 3,5-epimerase [Deltaproteobacteria bacterium]